MYMYSAVDLTMDTPNRRKTRSQRTKEQRLRTE